MTPRFSSFILLVNREGWGTSILMLSPERGDPRRMFIGGVGGLYRVLKYSGQWTEGVRQVRGDGRRNEMKHVPV